MLPVVTWKETDCRFCPPWLSWRAASPVAQGSRRTVSGGQGLTRACSGWSSRTWAESRTWRCSHRILQVENHQVNPKYRMRPDHSLAIYPHLYSSLIFSLSCKTTLNLGSSTWLEVCFWRSLEGGAQPYFQQCPRSLLTKLQANHSNYLDRSWELL